MKEIGGYFNLELNSHGGFLHDDGILLNSCRNALELVFISMNPQRVWIPKFVCDSVLQPINHLKLNYCSYSIDRNLEINDDIKMQDGDVIIYTNYFGIKDKYVEYLVNKYGNRLIVDNAQSFYSKHYKGISTVYSPRKFVGVPDGGIAYIDNPVQLNYQQDKSFDRCRHLLRRYDETASQGYSDFRVNEESLDNREIMLMSNLTKVLLRNVDFYFVKKRRTQNFEYLHKKIGKDNKLKIDMNSIECPLVYPFYTDNVNLRKQLISNKIFVATYWPNVISDCRNQPEFELANCILPLPIDQRYDIDEMDNIINVINK
jgi:hypothetical protein